MYLYMVENLRATKSGDYVCVLVAAESEDEAWNTDPRKSHDFKFFKYRWPDSERHKRVTYIGETHLSSGIFHIDQI